MEGGNRVFPSGGNDFITHHIARPGDPPDPPEESQDYNICFALQQPQWAPFVTLSKIFDERQSVNAGYAVERWRPKHFLKGFDLVAGHSVGNIFSGVMADVSVRDKDANILKLSYNVTLLGKIVFAASLTD
jgi:hypothetical protein